MLIKRLSVSHKYYLVLFDSKGKMLDRRRWNKNFHKNDAVRQFKRSGSLHKDLYIDILKNVYERTDYRKGARVRSGTYQYIVEIVTPDKRIRARSLQYDYRYPRRRAKEEAFENAMGMLSYSVNQVSDADKGFEIATKKGYTIREGIVRYSRR